VIELQGPWTQGVAYDVHSLSSTYVGPDEFGHDRYETTRSEMGELVYRLKYRQDASVLPGIIKLLDSVNGINQFDCIVPIPPTDKSRPWQPVTEIARALGARHNVAMLPDLLEKKPGGRALKDVPDLDERKALLRASLDIAANVSVAGRAVLLVDDLYRSGATLSAATELLQAAQARAVCVLTMTKTRSNR
jgi:competence protein ComFC